MKLGNESYQYSLVLVGSQISWTPLTDSLMLSRHRSEISTFCALGRGRSDDIDPAVFVPLPFRMRLCYNTLPYWDVQISIARVLLCVCASLNLHPIYLHISACELWSCSVPSKRSDRWQIGIISFGLGGSTWLDMGGCEDIESIKNTCVSNIAGAWKSLLLHAGNIASSVGLTCLWVSHYSYLRISAE